MIRLNVIDPDLFELTPEYLEELVVFLCDLAVDVAGRQKVRIYRA